MSERHTGPHAITRLVSGMRDTRISLLPVVLAGLAGLGIYVFLQIADEMAEGEIAHYDEALLLFFRDPADRSHPVGPGWLEQTMTEITSLGGYPVLVIMVGAVIGFLLVSRKFGPALFVFLSITSGTLAGHVLKLLYDRPRPDIVDHLVSIHTPSFPSGHATMSAVVYLTLASLIVRLVESRAVQVYVLTVAVALTLTVGISRIYLGVHWPSDVIAGWALGIAWACLSWLTVNALRIVRNRDKARS